MPGVGKRTARIYLEGNKLTANPQHAALYEAQAFGLVENRTVIEVRGADRSTFLHNLCTNNIKSLEAGQGCEAFFTNVQGKTLCHTMLFCDADSIWISTDPGIGDQLLPHLEKYHIREDVELTDSTPEVQTFLIAGPESAGFLEREFSVKLDAMLQHTAFADFPNVRVCRVPFARPHAFFLLAPKEQNSAIVTLLKSKGVENIDSETIELARVEAAFPSTGRDLTIENLPQEICRDELAISFTKGCYLGQETVARIDALGRVNKNLVSLQFEGTEVPKLGTVLTAGEKTVGSVTSACWSPKRECPIALGFVRREVVEQRSAVSSEFGAVKVVA